MKYTNPIIRGFYPDPSICYAEGFYYLVCSTFEYFPGIPIFRSNNLMDWEQIGHCLTRKSQLDLTQANASEGLFAPTIRYQNQRFYMVVTHVNGTGNFFVYTDNILGEWSEPIFINRPGIDPSFFFDEEKSYFISNGIDDEGKEGVSLCEINIETGEIISKAICISQGTGGRFIESPHLYKVGDFYYLLIAEGGTEYGHMSCILRSKEIYGPYESCPHNPILTNRNLGGYYIQGAGHADLIEGKDGQWWMVHLAFRQIDKWRQFHHLGREVFLAPVFWTDDRWIRVGDDGTSRGAYHVEEGICNRLDDPKYPVYQWELNQHRACFLRCPNYENYIFQENRTILLKGTEDKLTQKGNVTFVGMRQEEFDCKAEIEIDTSTMSDNQKAGITAYLSEANHYDIIVEKQGSQNRVLGTAYIGGMEIVLNHITIRENRCRLLIESNALEYFLYAYDNHQPILLGRIQSKYLSSEVAEGFTGVVIGIFCEATEQAADNYVAFNMGTK